MEHLDKPVVEKADCQERVHERVHIDRGCDVFVDEDAVTPVTENLAIDWRLGLK